MEAHGIKEADLLKSADLTQRAYFAAGLKKEDMFEAMKYYSGKANNIGFTGLEHQKKIYGIEGLAATKGIEGSQFGTNFSTFLGNLSKGVENLEYAGRGRKGELRKMMQSAGANFDFFQCRRFYQGFTPNYRYFGIGVRKNSCQIRRQGGHGYFQCHFRL